MTNKFKINYDLLQAQQQRFTRSGVLLKNVFGIWSEHPGLSVVFALSFGVLINGVYDLVAYLALDPELTYIGGAQRAALAMLFLLICVWVIVRLRVAQKLLFVDTPLPQKKMLITLVSKGRTNFRDTPSYNTYESLIHGMNGHPSVNALQEVVLVVTELPEVSSAANQMKAYIEASGRSAELYGISINGKSQLDIQRQMELMLEKMTGRRKAHEIIADYTGGTKDMSIALLKAAEKELVLPIYLNEAADGDHAKYS